NWLREKIAAPDPDCLLLERLDAPDASVRTLLAIDQPAQLVALEKRHIAIARSARPAGAGFHLAYEAHHIKATQRHLRSDGPAERLCLDSAGALGLHQQMVAGTCLNRLRRRRQPPQLDHDKPT